MQIGRFFSLGRGRVGQYLSARVLVIRTPFQPVSPARETNEVCFLGFDTLKQAQKFVQSVSYTGLVCQLRRSSILRAFPYEVVIQGQTDLARTLAFWDRRDHQLYPSSALSQELAIAS
jgi:hypothetical protein